MAGGEGEAALLFNQAYQSGDCLVRPDPPHEIFQEHIIYNKGYSQRTQCHFSDRPCSSTHQQKYDRYDPDSAPISQSRKADPQRRQYILLQIRLYPQ